MHTIRVSWARVECVALGWDALVAQQLCLHGTAAIFAVVQDGMVDTAACLQAQTLMTVFHCRHSCLMNSKIQHGCLTGHS